MARETVPPKDFRGLLLAPSNEQEVVLLFGLLLPFLDEPFSIDECREAFPDCTAIRSRDGRKLRIEFELLSANFHEHGHDPEGCDMIVCWKHNWPSCPERLEVLELSRIVSECKPEFVLDPTQTKYPQVIWDEKSFFDEAGASPVGYVREVYDFCRSQRGLSVAFGRGSRLASFTVRATSHGAPSNSLFGVYADGRIWPGFPDAYPEHIREEFRSRLARIDRISRAVREKAWLEFVIQNEEELEILRDTIRWLAIVDWRSG